MPSATKDTHIMQVRVPKPLWERFTAACHRSNATPSESIREFMRSMVREEQQVIEQLNKAEAELLSTGSGSTSPTDLGRAQWHRLRTGSVEINDEQEVGGSKE